MNQSFIERTLPLNNTKNIKEVAPFIKFADPDPVQIKIYRKRWVVLSLFMITTAVNNMQAMQIVVVENVMVRYYNVSSLAIECTALIFNFLYVILFIPVSFMVHKLDIRHSCLIVAIATCIGSVIKLFAVHRNGFVLTLVGQAIVGSWQYIILAVPSSLASYWYGPNQVATATALGFYGSTLGIALFSFGVPFIIRNHENLDDVGKDWYTLSLGVAIASFVIAVAMIIFFANEPPLPPSKSRALQKLHGQREFNFVRSMCQILKNKNYILLWNSHGLNNGIVNAVMATLNPVYLSHFKVKNYKYSPGITTFISFNLVNCEEEVGRMIMIIILSGNVGAFILGRIQDKTKKFKDLLIILYILTLIIQILFTVALRMDSRWAVHVTAALFGFISFAYITTGFETCVEITYPEPEVHCVAVLNLANQLYGLILTVMISKVMVMYSDFEAYICLCVILVFGLIITIVMEDVQKRQEAMKSPVYSNNAKPFNTD